jgi:hypothetical protein
LDRAIFKTPWSNDRREKVRPPNTEHVNFTFSAIVAQLFKGRNALFSIM